MQWTEWILALAAAAVQQPGAAAPSAAPCVPAGGSTAPTFDRPPLGEPGDPVDAEWVDGDPSANDDSGAPQAFEEDLVSDDPMGAAVPSAGGAQASVPVDNRGGDLSGPNGTDQNGGGEGDCIEVYVEWTYRYPVTVTYGRKLSLWGADVGETYTVVIWREGKKRSRVKEVCPC